MTDINSTETSSAAQQAMLSTGANPARRAGLSWLVAWTAVFSINLVAPITLGRHMLSPGGIVGMSIALLILFSAGYIIGGRSADNRLIALYGGVVVGISQIIPILQIVAGTVGLIALKHLARSLHTLTVHDFDRELSSIMSVLSGFILTAVTGLILLGAAALAGRIILDMKRSLSNSSRRADSMLSKTCERRGETPQRRPG